jgi:uncharacterized membrane protein YedE/YeeE
MTTSVLDRVPVESITAQAKQVRFWRTVLTLVAGLLFGLGWVVAKAFAVGWLAGAWVFVAARAGFRAGRGGPAGPSEPF